MNPLTPDQRAELDAEFEGKYLVEGELGRGGMGVVYLARQTGPLDRRVAIKIVKIGMDTEAFVRRFEAERRSLAAMSHPGIAAVLDAGATASGRPFYVMELVEGEELLDHCDDRRLPLRDRIRLFSEVCLGVQHAHQKGVVHRDLKPSNILVIQTPQGPRPKIIDFGIAKAMDDAEGLTAVDETIGTPAYMSPEQAAGEGDVDTRSDIYSLGIVIYRLLTGCLPFEDSAYRGWTALATSMMNDVPPPSKRVQKAGEALAAQAAARAVDPPRLARLLRGDLDWIVLRATERERERRYATVAELHDDLRRHLEDRPVEASPPSRAYRARKFVRRNPAAVGLAAALAVAILGFGVVQAALRAQVERARDDAVAARDDAEQTLDFMIGDLYEQLEPIGQLPILLSVGEAAMAYFANRPLDEFSDDELAARSQALNQLGSVHLAQGNRPEAQAAFEESLRLSRALSNRYPDDPEWLFDRGQSEFWVAELARQQGDLETQARHFEAYRDISVELTERDPDRSEWLLERGYAHTAMASVHRSAGRWSEARSEAGDALDVKLAVLAMDSSYTNLGAVATSWNWIGVIASESGDPEAAADAFEEEIEVRRALLRAMPDDARMAFALSTAEARLGSVLRQMEEQDGALEMFQTSLGRLQVLVAADPTNLGWRRELSQRLALTGELLLESGDRMAARDHLDRATAEVERLLEGDPTRLSYRSDRAGVALVVVMAESPEGEPPPLGPLQAVVDTLSALQAEGDVDGFTVQRLARARIALADHPAIPADIGREHLDASLAHLDATFPEPRTAPVEALRNQLIEGGASKPSS